MNADRAMRRRPRISSEKFGPLLLFAIQAAALLAVLIPFLVSNNLQEWDFPGHYAAIWHLRENLLPWHTGWNPYFYGGYPQGLFYPPLAHYLAALLSLGIGIIPAMKAMVAVSLLALPFTFHRVARSAGLAGLPCAVASSWMTALLFTSGEMFGAWSFGTDLRSNLNVGLFANAISLPLLFGFMAACAGARRGGRWRGAALLLGLLALTHPLAWLVALLFLAASLASDFGRERAELVPSLRAHGLVLATGMLVGGAWLAPYAGFRAYMNPEFIAAQWSPVLMLIILNGAGLALGALRWSETRPFGLFYLLLANFILVGSIGRLELQFTRLTGFLLLVLPPAAIPWARSRSVRGALLLLAGAVALLGYFRSGVRPRGVPDLAPPAFGQVHGRILSVTPASHLPAHHVSHDLIPPRTGNESMLGLFIEASLNGRFVANLTRLIEPDAYVWGTPTEAVRPEALGEDYAEYVRDRLRLFDVRHIYTDLKLESVLGPLFAAEKRHINSCPAPVTAGAGEEEVLRSRYHLRDGRLDFYLYTVGPGATAEALPYLPAVAATDWKLTTTHWFVQSRGVPVFTDHAIPSGVRPAREGEWVEALPGGVHRRDFRIHASEPVPVLVKMGFFPAWHASANGVSVPVYRAAPNLMLVFAKGPLTLEYRRAWQEYAGLCFTLAGLAIVFCTGFRQRPRSRNAASAGAAAPE